MDKMKLSYKGDFVLSRVFHSLSIDAAKICNSENNPRGRPVFFRNFNNWL